jgi:uncharacterized Zn-finger protein
MSQPSPGQGQPASPAQAPDPANNYERAKPERESPSGSLDQKYPRPHAHTDEVGPESTSGKHTNRPDTDSQELSTSVQPSVNPGQVQHSMRDEEPDGWDQAPTDIHDPQQKRHSRTEGKGGLS